MSGPTGRPRPLSPFSTHLPPPISLQGIPLLNSLAALGVIAAWAYAFFAIGWLYFTSPLAILLFAAVAIGLGALAARALATQGFAFPFAGVPHMRLAASVIALGLILRVAWVVAMPPVQVSDFQDYLTAARGL